MPNITPLPSHQSTYKCREHAVILVSGESKHCVSKGVAAVQAMLDEIIQKKLTHFVIDSGRGMTSGIRAIQQYKSTVLDDEVDDLSGTDDSSTNEDDSSDDSDLEDSESSENDEHVTPGCGDREDDEYKWARCTVHTLKNDLPKYRKKYPLAQGNFGKLRIDSSNV